MATDGLCLENLEEFVHDENKIVTCKWLSLTLKIHINQAKKLLYTFLQQQKKKNKELNATYFIAGLYKGETTELEHRCVVVAEEDLKSTRAQFSTVTSCHVYSIQQAVLKDSSVLYMTDYEGVRDNFADCNKYSSIHCKRAHVPRVRAAPAKSPQKPQPTGAEDGNAKQNAQKENGSSSSEKMATTAAAVLGGLKGKKAEPKGSIASMFAQSNKKADSNSAPKQENGKKEEAKENKPTAKKGSVMGMFANAKPLVKKTTSEPTPDVKEKADTKESKEKPATKDTKASEKRTSKVEETKGKRKSRKGDDSDDEDFQAGRKKRRRIKNDLFDSSSEEEMEIEPEEESPVPSPVQEPTPEPESPPPPAKKTPEKRIERKSNAEENTSSGGTHRRRKRKLVPKTYLDEEGFMVTEKVWESESASEVEEDTKKTAAPTPAPTSAPLAQKKAEPAPTKKGPQKKGSPVKGKQTSLTSFFRKK